MFEIINGGAGDAITGLRIYPNTEAMDTGFDSRETFEMRERSTRFITRSTLEFLIEKAGYNVCRGECACDTGDGNISLAQVVDGEDSDSGDREGPSRDPKSGRFSAARGSDVRELAR